MSTRTNKLLFLFYSSMTNADDQIFQSDNLENDCPYEKSIEQFFVNNNPIYSFD